MDFATVTETIPEGTSVVESDLAPGWVCSGLSGGALCRFQISNLPALSSSTVTVTVLVDGTHAGSVLNHACVSGVNEISTRVGRLGCSDLEVPPASTFQNIPTLGLVGLIIFSASLAVAGVLALRFGR